jgi:hypothetical protein
MSRSVVFSMSPIDFAKTRADLETYARVNAAGGTPFVLEAIMRLDQLGWLCERVAQVEADAAAIDWPAWQNSHGNVRFPPLLVELQTLTEAFYYMAWRLIALLDRIDGPIPTLRGLRSKCRGIRTVRNHLLEHPEASNSRVHVPSILFGSSEGPRLKFIAEVRSGEDGTPRFRTNRAELFDRGLWANAQELKSAMDARLAGGAVQ